jgi:2-polyprenyl-6-methoxyphenol hydroxylase-like FAD-dependent oxidoreductase
MGQVLIAGGGIGGLAAAVALHQAGIPVRVFEQAPELEEVGAGVSLWPNAMRVLARLGLFEAVLGDHVPLERIVVRRSDDRLLIQLLEPGRQPEPGICVHRAHLQQTLAAALPRDRLHLGRRLVGFESGPDDDAPVTALFHDESTEPGTLLVGCDGIHSVVRARLHGPEPARYRGYRIWRAVSDFELPAPLLRQSTEWWGPGRRFGLLPGEPGRVFWYATQTTDDGSGNENGSALAALFAGWPPPVPQLIHSASSGGPVLTDAEDRPVPRSWGAGPVTLLGDAAHPMTPNMGQGACAAIEDALVLADCLQRHGLSPHALRRYERARAPRTRWMVRQSRRIGRLGQLSSPPLVALRDQLMRRVPHRLTAPVQRRVYAFQVAGRPHNAQIGGF